jgi:CheY-like chemotaxis protein
MRRLHLQTDRHPNFRGRGACVSAAFSGGSRSGEDGCQTKRHVKGKPLILVVEDNAANQMLAREVLELAGYEVEVASTASQALDHLKTSIPALILMDVELPGKDGLSLTRLLKSMSPTTAIPVVALTAHTSLQARTDALQAGCVGFISKPIDVRTFSARVEEFLAPNA